MVYSMGLPKWWWFAMGIIWAFIESQHEWYSMMKWCIAIYPQHFQNGESGELISWNARYSLQNKSNGYSSTVLNWVGIQKRIINDWSAKRCKSSTHVAPNDVGFFCFSIVLPKKQRSPLRGVKIRSKPVISSHRSVKSFHSICQNPPFPTIWGKFRIFIWAGRPTKYYNQVSSYLKTHLSLNEPSEERQTLRDRRTILLSDKKKKKAWRKTWQGWHNSVRYTNKTNGRQRWSATLR